MPPSFNRNNYAHVTGSMAPQSPSVSTPIFTPSPLDPHIELDGEPDIGLDEFLNILQEDPAAVRKLVFFRVRPSLFIDCLGLQVLGFD